MLLQNLLSVWLQKNRSAKRRTASSRRLTGLVSPEALEARQLLSASNGAANTTASSHVQVLAAAAAVAAPPPFVQSITGPTKALTTPTADYTVTFSGSVTGVDATDFAVVKTGSAKANAAVTVTPVSGAVYKVTVSGIQGTGTVGIKLVDNQSIKDSSNQVLRVNFGTQTPTTISQPNNNYAEFIPADMNNDGVVDLVSQNGVTGQFFVLKGNGDGTYQAPSLIPKSPQGSAITIGDMNGDGFQDLIFCDATGVSVIKGNGDLTFQAPQHLESTTSLRVSAVADFNGDGTLQAAQQFSTGSRPYNFKLMDVNGDAKLDIVTANRDASSVSVLLGNGDGTFKPKVDFSTGFQATSLQVGDLNGDQRPDIVVASASTNDSLSGKGPNGHLALLKGNGDGTFQAPITLSSSGDFGSVNAADMNGDGKLDLITGGSSPATIQVILGKGDGTFQTPQTVGEFTVYGPIIATDLNRDGKVDLATAFSGFHIVLNSSSGSFIGPQTKLGKIVVNRAPTDLGSSPSAIAENLPAGTTVGTLATKDPDKGNTFTYSLVSGAGSTDNASFTIAGGVLKTNQAFNFEVKNTYSIRIRTTDQGGLFFEKVLTIKIGDVNDAPSIAPQTKTVIEKSANGTVVGTVAASDEDAKQKLTFAISSGNDGNVFAINSTTGQITVANGNGLVFATKSSYQLQVKITDNGKPKPLTSTAVITINLQQAVVSPAVLSIGRATGDPITTASTSFTVTFNKPVTGVAASNFVIVTTGGVTANQTVVLTPVSSTVYTVTVAGISQTAPGTLGVKLVDPQGLIKDTTNTGLGANYTFVGQAVVVQIPVVTLPAVVSISRGTNDPITTATTDFTVTFSKPVTGVVSGNFEVAKTGGVIANSLVVVTPVSSTVYTVTVSGIDLETAGTLGLNLVFGDDTIRDTNQNGLGANYQFVGPTYPVQVPNVTTPIVTGISGANNPITTATTDFTVTFNSPVTGVTASNFVVVTTGGVIANANVVVTQLASSAYKVTVSGIDLETPGTLGLNVVVGDNTIQDANQHGLGANYQFVGPTYPVQVPNVTNPSVVSLDRGTSDPVTSEATGFTVTFNEPVTGVTASNFVVVTTGGAIASANVVVTQLTPTTFTATVTGIDFETAGTLGMNLIDPSGLIKDANQNGLGANYQFTGQAYPVQNGAPATPIILSILKSDQFPVTGTTADFRVIFNEAVSGVTAANFFVDTSDSVTADSTVVVTQVSGSVYIVQVTGIAATGSDGTLKLDFYDFSAIKDVNNNSMPANYSYGGLTYTVQAS